MLLIANFIQQYSPLVEILLSPQKDTSSPPTCQPIMNMARLTLHEAKE